MAESSFILLLPEEHFRILSPYDQLLGQIYPRKNLGVEFRFSANRKPPLLAATNFLTADRR